MKHPNMKRGWIGLVMLALLLSAGCAGNKTGKDKDTPEDRVAAETLYNQSLDSLKDGQYDEAASSFDEVERTHPFSKWATHAQIMAAYAHYKNRDYNRAVSTLERFIELHPGSDSIAYAHYLKAISYYEQITDVRRDQGMTRKAYDNLQTVVKRYPDTPYARDASLKLDLTRDHLAGKEMDIGRYYLTRGHYHAALNRFRKVVRDYQTTMHTPEALHRLVEAYKALGLRDEARRTAAVLGYNYPDSTWYADSYRLLDKEQLEKLIADRSFIDRAVDRIFRPD